jgi:hypothetical protein
MKKGVGAMHISYRSHDAVGSENGSAFPGIRGERKIRREKQGGEKQGARGWVVCLFSLAPKKYFSTSRTE